MRGWVWKAGFLRHENLVSGSPTPEKNYLPCSVHRIVFGCNDSGCLFVFLCMLKLFYIWIFQNTPEAQSEICLALYISPGVAVNT